MAALRQPHDTARARDSKPHATSPCAPRGPDHPAARGFATPGGQNRVARRGAAHAGAGILVAPMFLVEDDLRVGRLVAILRDYLPPSGTLDAVCPAHRAASPKVRGLISFLTSRLA